MPPKLITSARNNKMAKQKDVFGIDELVKSFDKISEKYPSQADAVLMTMGRAANRRVKQLTPVKTRKLRNSWRLKKVKLYKNGTVRVVRIQSSAPHAHLIESGHRIIRGTGRSKTGRRTVQRKALGSTGTRTKEYKMLEEGIKETSKKLDKSAADMIEKLTKELEV